MINKISTHKNPTIIIIYLQNIPPSKVDMMISRKTVFLASFLLSTINLFNVSHSIMSCPKKAEYNLNSTSGRAYRNNVESLLSKLSSKGSNPKGFYNFTAVKSGAPKAYGLFYCYGYVTPTDCKTCVETASSETLENCPNTTWAVNWADKCILRFSNESIFSRLDTSPDATWYLWVTSNVSDIGLLNKVLGDAFDEIANRASNDVSGRKYAVKVSNYTNFEKIYSMGQCSPDLSDLDCYICLRQAISKLPECCYGSRGGNVLYPSCRIRYDMYPYFLPPPPPPPPANT